MTLHAEMGALIILWRTLARRCSIARREAELFPCTISSDPTYDAYSHDALHAPKAKYAVWTKNTRS